MTINGNQTLRVMAHGLAPNSFYVQGVRINGKQWTKNWFNHEDIMIDGGTIEFDLGPDMTQWESGDVPPSPGHVEL